MDCCRIVPGLLPGLNFRFPNPTLKSQRHNNKNIKKIKVVNKSIDKAHGLPNECYTSKEYLTYERKKIFEDKWVVVGIGSSIPNIGDAKPFDLLGIPLIILRDKNKNIIRLVK